MFQDSIFHRLNRVRTQSVFIIQRGFSRKEGEVYSRY